MSQPTSSFVITGKRTMRIPPDQLSAPALNGIIEEFITREGTDYGQREALLAEKIQQVKAQIDRGEVIILYDSESQTCNLVSRTAPSQSDMT